MAQLGERLARERGGAPRPRLRELHAAQEAPLSSAQRRLLFLHQMDPESATYHMPFRLRWQGSLEPAVLAAALDAIVRRHEVLRTAFAAGERDWAPVVCAGPPALCRVDLCGLPAGRREAEAGAVARRAAVRPFDLARPPLRFLLVRQGGGEQELVAVLHHILADGWSLDILGRELTALYTALSNGLAAGGEQALPAPPAQYADFARWRPGCLRAASATDGLAGAGRRRLRPDGLRRAEAATEQPRPAVQRGAAAASPRAYLAAP